VTDEKLPEPDLAEVAELLERLRQRSRGFQARAMVLAANDPSVYASGLVLADALEALWRSRDVRLFLRNAAIGKAERETSN
jgi:hypothetical protein